jgi:hypothetical protein
VQFVPICNDAAFNLNISANRSTPRGRVVVSENSNEFAQRRFRLERCIEDNIAARFLSQRMKLRCYPAQVVTKLAGRQAAVCLIDEL